MFFKKNKNENNDFSKVAALLIHAAKIDENFSKSEETIIKPVSYTHLTLPTIYSV